MALSLQVKKFINSEHMGNYVEILLPGYPTKDGEPTPEAAKMHYVEAGSGEPLILVHTVGQSLYTWRNVFEELSRHYRVIAVDLLGHGFSSRPIEFDYTIGEQSMALSLFMEALGIKSAHMVGFSMGGLYVLDLCARYPEKVGRVIVISPGGITQEMPLAVRMIDSSLFGSIASKLYSMKTVRKVLEETVFDLTTITSEVVEQYYHTASSPASRKAIQLSLHNFDEREVESRLREIENHVLILWGAEDKWHAPSMSELYHAALVNANFGIIRNAGHLVHEEKAPRFMDAIREYIPVFIEE